MLDLAISVDIQAYPFVVKTTDFIIKGKAKNKGASEVSFFKFM